MFTRWSCADNLSFFWKVKQTNRHPGPSNSLLGSVGGQPLNFFVFFLASLPVVARWSLNPPSAPLLSLVASLLLLLFIFSSSARDWLVNVIFSQKKLNLASNSGRRDQFPVSSRPVTHWYCRAAQKCDDVAYITHQPGVGWGRGGGGFSQWGSDHTSLILLWQRRL